MIDKLHSIISRYDELEETMSRVDAMQNIKAYAEIAREHTAISELVEHAKKYINTYNQIKEDEEILNGDEPEFKELVKTEIGLLRQDLAIQEEKLKILLIVEKLMST